MPIILQTSLASPGNDPSILISNVDCDPSVTVGSWVRMNTSNTLVLAKADSLSNSNVLGLVESKQGSTKATVRTSGISTAIFSGLDVTKEYFLKDSVAGEMVVQTGVLPTAPGSVILVLGKPLTASRFLVRIGTRIVRS